MAPLTTGSLISEEAVESFRRDGFVIVRSLFSGEEMEVVRERFMDLAKDGPVPGLSDVHSGASTSSENDPLKRYPRMMHPHLHPELEVGDLSMQMMLDRRIEEVLLALMGEQPYAVQTMFYFKPPGSRGQDFHQDNFYLKVKPGTCMAAWVAIDRSDEENGGMMCVPETANLEIKCPTPSNTELYFTSDHVEPPEGLRPIHAILDPGDVLFFNGSTIHGSGPNISRDRFRRAFICHYVPASTLEMSHYYKAFDFAGNRVEITANQDGGPCGTVQEAKGPH